MEYVILIIILLSFAYEVVIKSKLTQNKSRTQSYSKSPTIKNNIKYLSTSMIAKKNNVSRDDLFEYLLKEKYLDKNHQYIILDKAHNLGAKYKTKHVNEEWIVWPDNALNHIVKNLPKKQIKKNNSWSYRGYRTKIKSTNSNDSDFENFGPYETYYQDKDSRGWK